VLKDASDALTFKWKQLVREFNQHGGDLTGQQKAVSEYLELLASARGSGPVDSLRWGSALTRVSRLTEIPVEDLNRRFKQRRPSSHAGSTQRAAGAPQVPSAVPIDATGEEPHPADIVDVPAEFADGDVESPRARQLAERWILAVLLQQPERWSQVLHDVQVTDFRDSRRRKLAQIYWEHQRDEGEPVFNEFLNTLEPDLADLAVELAAEFEQLGDAALRLTEAVALLADEKNREERQKLPMQIRRTNDNAEQDDLLRKAMEHARKPDLRRA
jgi:hypothetical protein